MSPQDARFNRGYWAKVERFVRSLTDQFDDLYVLTGPLYLPQLDVSGNWFVKYQVIGNPPNISVPSHFFKGIVP